MYLPLSVPVVVRPPRPVAATPRRASEALGSPQKGTVDHTTQHTHTTHTHTHTHSPQHTAHYPQDERAVHDHTSPQTQSHSDCQSRHQLLAEPRSSLDSHRCPSDQRTTVAAAASPNICVQSFHPSGTFLRTVGLGAPSSSCRPLGCWRRRACCRAFIPSAPNAWLAFSSRRAKGEWRARRLS